MRKNKKNRYLTLLLILLAVSIGYAALSTTLKIIGTTNISKQSWSVYWDEESIAITQDSKGNTEPDVVNGDDGSSNTKVTWEVTLDLPGDFYEFTIDAANAGTVDAMITGITPTVPSNLPSYISYSVTYADDEIPAQYHLLEKKKGDNPTREKYKIRVEYLDTVTPDDLDEIDDEGDTYQFSYQVTYGQADEHAIKRKVVPLEVGQEVSFGTEKFRVIKSDLNTTALLATSPIPNAGSDSLVYSIPPYWLLSYNYSGYFYHNNYKNKNEYIYDSLNNIKNLQVEPLETTMAPLDKTITYTAALYNSETGEYYCTSGELDEYSPQGAICITTSCGEGYGYDEDFPKCNLCKNYYGYYFDDGTNMCITDYECPDNYDKVGNTCKYNHEADEYYPAYYVENYVNTLKTTHNAPNSIIGRLPSYDEINNLKDANDNFPEWLTINVNVDDYQYVASYLLGTFASGQLVLFDGSQFTFTYGDYYYDLIPVIELPTSDLN